MKKGTTLIVIIVAVLGGIYIIGKGSGMFAVYKTNSGSMEPTLNIGDRFIVSNLKKPKIKDLIIFKKLVKEDEAWEGTPGSTIQYVSRLIAKGGDVLELRNGLAYVNNKLIDDSLRLKFIYLSPKKDAEKLFTLMQLDENDPNLLDKYSIKDSLVSVTLTGKQYMDFRSQVTLNKYNIFSPGDTTLYGNTSGKWTLDNYGPLKIPDGHFFVLGDYRHGANDSRFIGAIRDENWTGTVLNKK